VLQRKNIPLEKRKTGGIRMFLTEEKFVTLLRTHMLETYFHTEKNMAAGLNLEVEEMKNLHPSDLAAKLFKYAAVHKLPLDTVIMQMAK